MASKKASKKATRSEIPLFLQALLIFIGYILFSALILYFLYNTFVPVCQGYPKVVLGTPFYLNDVEAIFTITIFALGLLYAYIASRLSGTKIKFSNAIAIFPLAIIAFAITIALLSLGCT